MELMRESIVWWYVLIVLVAACFAVLLWQWKELKRKKKKTSLMSTPSGYRGYIIFGLALSPLILIVLAVRLWGGFFCLEMPDAQTIEVRYAPPLLSQKIKLEHIEKVIVDQSFHPGNRNKKAKFVFKLYLVLRSGRELKSVEIYSRSIATGVIKGFEHLNVPVVVRRKKGLS